ncbi:HYR domain-containing protein, partial [Polaribacter gangjinensis]
TWTAPTVTDNCSVSTFVSSHQPGDFFPVGTTTVTYTATDIHGNVITSSFTVTINDTEKPVISGMPSNITQNNDLGVCGATVTWT